MKKIISIFAMFSLIISLAACGNNEAIKESKPINIKLAALTEEEEKIINLFGHNEDSKVYDYTIDESITTIHVKKYILDDNLEWTETDKSGTVVKSLEGRIAFTLNETGDLRVGFQENGISSSWGKNSEINIDASTSIRSTSWFDGADIIYEEEIPLAIQIFTNSDVVTNYSTDGFYHTEKLEGHDKVIAITITFSQDQLW